MEENIKQKKKHIYEGVWQNLTMFLINNAGGRQCRCYSCRVHSSITTSTSILRLYSDILMHVIRGAAASRIRKELWLVNATPHCHDNCSWVGSCANMGKLFMGRCTSMLLSSSWCDGLHSDCQLKALQATDLVLLPFPWSVMLSSYSTRQTRGETTPVTKSRWRNGC